MANAYKDMRYIIDTAGATLLKAGLTPGRGNLRVKGIRWVAATTAGHTCIIQDADSIVLWESVCTGANYVESDQIEREWVTDFKVTTLASGRLYVYLGKW